MDVLGHHGLTNSFHWNEAMRKAETILRCIGRCVSSRERAT